MNRGVRPRAVTLAVVGATLLAGASACRDVEGIRVAALHFEGNEAFSDAELNGVVRTRESGSLPWSQPEIFNRQMFERTAVEF